MTSSKSGGSIDKTAGFGDPTNCRYEHSHVRPGVMPPHLKSSEEDNKRPPLASSAFDTTPLRQRFVLRRK